MAATTLVLVATGLLAAPSASAQASTQGPAYVPTPHTLFATQDSSSCNKSPCILYPKSTELPSGRLVAAFEDSQGPVVGQTLPIYKSDDHGASWQQLSSLAPPATLSSDPSYAAYTSNWTNPYFYVLPRQLGSLQAGTLLLADVVSGAGTGSANRGPIAIALYSSTNGGRSWRVVNIIATGGPESQDPVWEPYLMMYGNQLVTYYSDSNNYLGYDPTTGVAQLDPANATDPGGNPQILAHRTWNGSGSWSAPVVDVAGTMIDMGGGKTELGGGRPGMANVVATADGKWMLTFEYWGGGDNVRFKIADNPLDFFADSTQAGNGISSLPVTAGSNALAQGGSPVIVSLPDGRLVYNAAGSGDVWVNDSGSSTGSWKEYLTSVPAGYSRDLQYVSATGRLEILQAPWGTGPVSYAQVDLGDSAGAYFALVNRATGQVLSPQGSDTQDAVFTGNAPDIGTEPFDAASDSQWWHLMSKGSSFTLLNKGGGRALGIWEGNATQGAPLAQWVDDGGTDKIWNVTAASNGYVKLESTLNPSLYVTSESVGNVQLESTSTNADQQWRIVPESQG